MNTNQITTSVELITPEKASEYLSHNTMNRPLNKSRLAFYSHLMKSEEWGFDPSSNIVFAEDGTLLNGQHRLQALIATKTTAEFFVVHGAKKSDFIFMDAGKSRDGGDTLALHGYLNYKGVASIISLLLTTFRKERTPTTQGKVRGAIESFVSNGDILKEYENSPDLYQSILNIASREYKKYRLFPVSSYGAICAHLVKDKHHDLAKVEEFYKSLNDGTEYEYLTFLRKKILQAQRHENIMDKFPLLQRQVMLSKAWNYFIAGEDRKKIVYRPGDKIHFD